MRAVIRHRLSLWRQVLAGYGMSRPFLLIPNFFNSPQVAITTAGSLLSGGALGYVVGVGMGAVQVRNPCSFELET